MVALLPSGMEAEVVVRPAPAFSVMEEFASAEFGIAVKREFDSVPLEMFPAFVASVVALAASPRT